MPDARRGRLALECHGLFQAKCAVGLLCAAAINLKQTGFAKQQLERSMTFAITAESVLRGELNHLSRDRDSRGDHVEREEKCGDRKLSHHVWHLVEVGTRGGQAVCGMSVQGRAARRPISTWRQGSKVTTNDMKKSGR